MISVNSKIVKIGHFPDGTQRIDIKAKWFRGHEVSNITWKYENDSELFTIICLVGHMRSLGSDKIILILPYIPNARQDRVKSNADVFTLKYFAQTINSLNFVAVHVLDPHSYVSAALFDRVVIHEPFKYISTVVMRLICSDNLTIFYPDEGAMKRYSFSSESFLMGKPYCFGIKNRDWKTGEIKSLEVNGDKDLIAGHDILIVDDICSRGGTFYHSAKILKNLGANKIYLWVSHLENTVHDGELLKSDLIEKIYTASSLKFEPHKKIHSFYDYEQDLYDLRS